MAPRPPTKPKPTHKPPPPSSPRISKPAPKRTKLLTKRTRLLARLTRNPPSPSSSAQKQKRRRPSKKLITSLDSLADALPSPPTTTTSTNNNNKNAADEPSRQIAHRSLKSGRGVGRKREKVVGMERERFARNLAEMAGGEGKEGGSRERWEAIRRFVGGGMEVR